MGVCRRSDADRGTVVIAVPVYTGETTTITQVVWVMFPLIPFSTVYLNHTHLILVWGLEAARHVLTAAMRFGCRAAHHS